MGELSNGSKRNEGIELLRCVSMIMILTLHILARGGVLSHTTGLKAQYCTAWYLETLAYCAVNTFALISGFVCREQKFKISGFVLRWLEVFFWLAIPLAVAMIFFPDIEVESIVYAQTFSPVTVKTFWYFNAYLLLYMFTPILNLGLERLDRRSHKLIILFLFVTTSLLHVFNGGDDFALNSGYSGLWLIILYVSGAYFRLYGFPKWVKLRVAIPGFIISTTLAWVLEMLKVDLTRAKLIESKGDVWNMLNRAVNYTSPFMVLMSIFLLIIFVRIKIKNETVKNIITLFGKCSFGVYVFHVGPIIWQNYMKNRFISYSELPAPLLVLAVIGTAIILFIVFDIFSIIRYMIFKYCGINKLIMKIFPDKE